MERGGRPVVMARAGTFYGRGPELALLKRTLLPGEAGGSPPLVLIHGAEEIGKTALVHEFGRQVLAEKTGHPAAAFWWEGPVRAGTLGQFVELLLASGRSNVPRLQQSRGVLSGNKGPEAEGDGGPAERRVSAYNNDGTVRDLENTPLVTLAEEEVLLAERFVERLVMWVGSAAEAEGDGGPSLARLFRMIFVFDAFESYPTAVKNWVGRHLLPAMQSTRGLPGQSLLLTGRQSWEEGEQGDYWQAPPGSFHQLALSPLDRHACEQWLAAVGEDVGKVDLLLERTDGFPGRIERILAVRKWWEQVQAESGVLAGYSARERRWLHAAAMARTMNAEMLNIMLGRREAEEAFGWLREQEGIGWWEAERDESGERLHLREEVRDEIIRQVSSRVPARHREFLEKMHLWTEVSSRVESLHHRHYLGELSPIQPFNEEMIRDLFGANG